VLGLILLTLFSPHHGSAQPGAELKALQKDIEALKEGQRAIQQELQEIKSLLRARQAPPLAETQDIVLNIDDGPFRGDRSAKLTLIEFSDYQCPFCARHFREILPQIEREYIQSGKVKYVFRDFPLESIHKEAFKAAEAAHCAGEQGKYWEMHDQLFAHQKALGLEGLLLHAQGLGIDLQDFRRCLDSGKHATKIRKDIADGQKAGVRATPTFFLGLTEPNDSKVKALRVIRGAQPYARFKEAIDGLLAPQN
jgi:protein-disulfide isomerase